MRTPLLLITVLIAVVYACNQSISKRHNTLLAASALPAEFFTIDITRDTTLVTKNHAIIHIPHNAIQPAQGNTVKLEVKEAYSMEDIISAGLVTESNGKALSSGGMIYIHPAEGVEASLTGTISLATPTEFLLDEMQLYKGELKEDGSINWKDTLPMAANQQLTGIQKGEALFGNTCARCHSIGTNLTGPALMHVASRSPSKELMYEFTRNSQSVLAGSNRYYKCLFETWNKTPMPPFELTNEDLDNLYAFIDNESKKYGPPPPVSPLPSCYDSCDAYEKAKSGLVKLREALVEESGPLTVQEHIDFITADNNPCINCPPAKVVPLLHNATYYQFNIKSFGWSNIDVLMEQLPELNPGKLSVKITENNSAAFDIFFIIPEYKTFQQGGPLKGAKDTYGFYDEDGTVFLPRGKKAWVFVLGEGKDEILFAKKSFITSDINELELALQKISKQDFDKEIASMQLDRLAIGVGDAKNAEEIRKTDRELKVVEDLKPKNCDCNCGRAAPAMDTTLIEQQ